MQLTVLSHGIVARLVSRQIFWLVALFLYRTDSLGVSRQLVEVWDKNELMPIQPLDTADVLIELRNLLKS